MASCTEHGEWPREYLACPKCFKDGDVRQLSNISDSSICAPSDRKRMADESIWTARDCAAYFKVSPKHFLRDLRFRERFPPQLPWSIEGRPRWAAQAVKEWALRQDYAKAA